MFEGTTIIGVRYQGQTALAGDGQVTMSEKIIMKSQSKKVRRLYHGKVAAGFAGSVADAFALFDMFEGKLEAHQGNLPRACVELAKSWRTDRTLRQLQAMLVVADTEHLLMVSGTGEVIEPDDGLAAIGSGGPYALAAARALARHSSLGAEEIARTSLEIAASICVYTNDQIIVERV
ncbi:MAG: ATP-dependent protease subunit HslV [Peptococcaceae bacterium]|jgi:ATP-dependent HslUV protease subunit HslV|nr:ATP-dependent protease subunit HslV [Peptococcaceae bacterium]